MPRPRSITADAVIVAICTFQAERGFPPTMRELAAACGFASTRNLYRYLEPLRDAGRVTWEPGSPRTLRVLDGLDDRGSGSR